MKKDPVVQAELAKLLEQSSKSHERVARILERLESKLHIEEEVPPKPERHPLPNGKH